MLAQQAEQSRRMDGLRRQVAALANGIPPPPEFQEGSGVLMHLVGEGQEAFYASATPLTAGQFLRFLQAQPPSPERSTWETRLAVTPPEAALGGVSWHEARRLCEWLSAQDGVAYHLPTAREAGVLVRASGREAPAFWGAETWEPPDHRQRRDLKRFAVELVTVWDPAAGLTARAGAGGEVPFARYPSLLVYLVASRQAGIAHRWQRVRGGPP
jgi:hypothetical protein